MKRVKLDKDNMNEGGVHGHWHRQVMGSSMKSTLRITN